MKLPRRSPFLGSRQEELLGVYRQLYPYSPYVQGANDGTGQWTPRDQREALSVVQLWLNRSVCPFAVETTAALAQSILLDQHMQQFAASTSGLDARYALEQMGGGAEVGIRINYSMAIIRFVNSIVDSYQTGGFAQSIAVIAQRIGLPLWFVELRHAATHEELPSLDVCREATHYALQWLDDNFWTPQLFLTPAAISAQLAQQPVPAPSEAEAEEEAAEDSGDEEEALRQAEERHKAVQDVCSALKHYRDLSKRVLRDRSLASTHRDELRKYARQVGAFVHRRRSAHPTFAEQVLDMGGASRLKPSENDDTASSFVSTLDPDEVDECTKSALAQLVTEMLKPGGMIPQSKTKRVAATAVGAEIELPAEVGAIWDPLLAYLGNTFGRVFALTLADELIRIVSFVPRTSPFPDEEEADKTHDAWKDRSYANKSYRTTADAWMRHLVSKPSPAVIPLVPHTVTGTAGKLLSEVDLAHRCFRTQTPALVPLLVFLCAQDPSLNTRVGSLVQVLQINQFVGQDLALPPTSSVARPQTHTPQFDQHLDEMHERLRTLQSLEQEWALQNPAPPKPSPKAAPPVEPPASPDSALPTGWRLAPSTWSPTPLGCINGTVPALFLDF